MPGNTVLHLQNIHKSFGAVRALRGVTLEVRAGEVHALLGENGAGKSTLIKVATGAHAPDEGTLTIDGVNHARLTPASARAHGIACIYQQPVLFPDLSIAENLAIRLEASGAWRWIDWPERNRRARELLAAVGADALSPDALVRTLSMPQQQLVEMAAAVEAGAKVVIMDEPTASLSQLEQERLFAIVRSMRERGLGVVYISHRLEEIVALADRVTVLRDGQSVGTRAAAEVTSAQLINLMVGRDLEQLYPPALGSPGDLVFEARGLGGGPLVRDISFSVRAGEIFGIGGLVGAGRTELARTIFGITPPTNGQILLRGKPVRVQSPRDAVRNGIAYLPEDRRRHGVVLELPIERNISMAAQRALFPRGWIRRAIERSLADRFISRFAIRCAGREAPAGSLSGGNQQKVALARWLATEPRLLILDEPTQGVDVGAKSEVHALIRQLAKDGLAVIMISSDLPELLGMSDRIGVMRAGRLVEILPGGSPAVTVMSAALGVAKIPGAQSSS